MKRSVGLTGLDMEWKKKRKQLLSEAQERKALQKKQRIERFKTMEPFNTIDEIPNIPILENKDDYQENSGQEFDSLRCHPHRPA